MVLLQVAKFADAPRVTSSITVLALSCLLRSSVGVITLSTHTLGVEYLSGMWAIRYRLSTYLWWLYFGDGVKSMG